MANSSLDFMKDVLAAPLGEVISSIGKGVAEAQAAMDEGSLAQTLEIYSENDDATIKLLRDIGYRPTFYAIPQVEAEVKISLALSAQSISLDDFQNSNTVPAFASKKSVKTQVYATPMNASTSNKYNFSTEASTTMKFTIVPVPPAEDVTDIRVAPDLIGRTLTDIELVLGELDLAYEIVDSETGIDEVSAQSPAPGTLLKSDDIIEIQLLTP